MAQLIVVLVMTVLFSWGAPVAAFPLQDGIPDSGGARAAMVREYFPNLSAEEARGVEPVADEILARMRGRAAKYYCPANVADSTMTEITDPSMADMGVRAFVGSIENSSGLIHIIQVPGNHNVITSVMNLKIVIINGTDVSKLLPNIAGF
ncbi:MAG: hypothetical protein V2A77_05395 [Pseudomonadota bacterium]